VISDKISDAGCRIADADTKIPVEIVQLPDEQKPDGYPTVTQFAVMKYLDRSRSRATWTETTSGDFNDGTFSNTAVGVDDVRLAVQYANWWDANWSCRCPITITGGSNAVTNYPVKIDVTYDANMQADFDDIRFTDSYGVTLIDHWCESYTASTSATFWVEVPSIPAGPDTVDIYMYYGNSSATSASDKSSTFGYFMEVKRITLPEQTTAG
jgi:hypothetical protein